MKKNEHGQYVIKYDGEMDGDENGAWIALTPLPYPSRTDGYFMWMQVDNDGTTVLVPLREAQIAVFEQAFAEWRRNVQDSKDGKY